MATLHYAHSDLALLNAHGVIDGILTDDLEALLYGAHNTELSLE